MDSLWRRAARVETAAMRDGGRPHDQRRRKRGDAPRVPSPMARRILDTVRFDHGDPVGTVEKLAAAWRLSPRSLERRCRPYRVRAKDVVDFIKCGRVLLGVSALLLLAVFGSATPCSAGATLGHDAPNGVYGTQAVRHEFVLEIPESLNLFSQPLEVTAPGLGRLRVTHSQPIAITLQGERATIAVRYPSGLVVSTVVRWSDLHLRLPDVTAGALTVVDSARVGIPMASVRAQGGAGRYSWLAEVTTSAHGRAVLEYPKTDGGLATIRIDADGYEPYVGEADVGENGEVAVALRATAGATGELRHGDLPGQARLQAWEVSEGRRRMVDIAVSGVFALDDLAAGLYDFAFVVPGSGVLVVPAMLLSPGTRIDLGVIDLAPAGSVSGVVLTPKGVPVPHVRVRLVASGLSGSSAPEAHTDRRGRFEIPKVLLGQYTVELYSEDVGWSVEATGTVAVHEGANDPLVLEFRPSGCSLRIEFVGGIDEPVTYSVLLPVSDGATFETLQRTPEERVYPSLPCGGVVTVLRDQSESAVYAMALEYGESYLVVDLSDRRVLTDVLLTIGGSPVAGASLWVLARDTPRRALKKGRSFNRTDSDGRALLELPEHSDLTLHIELGRVLSIVEHVGPWLRLDYLHVDLPDRRLRVFVRDVNGRGLAGVSLEGYRLGDGSGSHGTGLPAGAVTGFARGLTDAGGLFEVSGLADGEWRIHISEGGSPSRSAEVNLRPLPSVTTIYVDGQVRERE